MTRRVALAAIVACGVGGSALAAPLVIRARAFDGAAWHERFEIEIDGGVIVRAGEPTGGPALELAGAALVPGLVDCDARLGLSGRGEELEEAVATDLHLADMFAPRQDESADFRASGVTAAWLDTPGGTVVAGHAAIVVPTAGAPRVDRAAWGLAASLASWARDPDRAPASLPEQAEALERAPKGAGPLRVRFDDGASLRHAARLGIPLGLPQRREDLIELPPGRALVASADWASVTDEALGPLVAWAREGRLALGSGESVVGARALRLAAHRLVELGVDPSAALRAMTRDAADVMGSPSRGRLEAGARADVVLWLGDPTSLASRPIRAWVSGEEVYRAP